MDYQLPKNIGILNNYQTIREANHRYLKNSSTLKGTYFLTITFTSTSNNFKTSAGGLKIIDFVCIFNNSNKLKQGKSAVMIFNKFN